MVNERKSFAAAAVDAVGFRVLFVPVLLHWDWVLARRGIWRLPLEWIWTWVGIGFLGIGNGIGLFGVEKRE